MQYLSSQLTNLTLADTKLSHIKVAKGTSSQREEKHLETVFQLDCVIIVYIDEPEQRFQKVINETRAEAGLGQGRGQLQCT